MYLDDEGEGSSDEEDFVYARYDEDDQIRGSGLIEYQRRIMQELLHGCQSDSEDPDDSSTYMPDSY